MKTLTKTILAALAITGALFGQQAQATMINGNITFAGTVTLDTNSAGTAHEVISWHNHDNTGNPAVSSRDGDFASFVTVGDGTTFSPNWFFNSGPVASFWTIDGFTFDLTESHIVFQGGHPASVTVNGTGYVSGNGFMSTFGTWNFSTQDPAAGSPPVFSFSAATGATAVPDGGSAVALLGVALAGIEILRRKLRTA